MTDFLEGRVVLVTGSTQGIGLAIAKAFAAEGARLAVHGIATTAERDAALMAVAEAGAKEVRFFEANLTDPGAIAGLVAAVDAWGPLDVVVNNAGIQRTASLKDVSTALWNDILAVNLSAAFHTMRHALPAMAARGYGRVVNIASVHGLVASVDKGPYVAAKFGLVGLSRVAALEYAAAGSRESGGVTVNCICPGWTETSLIEPQVAARAAELGGERLAGVASLLAEKQPSRRLSSPAEIGGLAVWLSSPLAHNITGTAIPVDGGWTAQ